MNNLFSDFFGILFFIVIYIPVNIIVMLIAALLFSVINKVVRLQFSALVVAIAAAIMVFVLMMALVSGGSRTSGQLDFGDMQVIFYISTFAINTLVVLIMLSASGVRKMIFKNQVTETFVFGIRQKIATGIYIVATVFCAAIPFISQARTYMADKNNKEHLQALSVIVKTDNLTAFKEEVSQNNRLWQVRSPDERQYLIDYLITNNKTDMVGVLLKDRPEMFSYNINWKIDNLEMLQTLMQNGMNADMAANILTESNRADLVKLLVAQYKPRFDTLVPFVVKHTLDNDNMELLDYLIQHGLAKNSNQANAVLSVLAKEDDFDAIRLLIKKGFLIDTTNVEMIHSAINNGNLPMLKFLFKYPFNVNTMNDEYTNVENAIIGDNPKIFDYLLTLKPDVTTLHITKQDGETNALKIAESHEQPEMLKKLTHYTASK